MRAPKIDAVEAAAMSKITRTTLPVKLLKRPAELARTRAELERLTQARAVDLESGLIARLLGRIRFPLADLPIDIHIRVLQQRQAQLEAEEIDGVLTVLSEADVWEVRTLFASRSIYLRKRLAATNTAPQNPKGPDQAAQAAARASEREALDMIGEQYWKARWVEAALRKPGPDAARYWADGESANAEPGVIDQLFNAYHQAFTLTEEELGKFAAPTSQKAS